MEIIIKEEEEEEVRKRRQSSFANDIQKNYENTFIEPVRKAINRLYAKGKVKKIVITAILNQIGGIDIIDENGKKINDKNIENLIRKYWANKKKANDSNSDRYFKERGKQNQVDNLRHRSLGEEVNYFPY